MMHSHSVLSALALYGQTVIGLCLYLLEKTGTPGYGAMLLSAPYVLLCLSLSRGTEEVKGPVRWPLLLALWIDGQIALWGISALCAKLLSDYPPWLYPIAAALFAWVAAQPRALSIAARPLCWLIGLPLVYCAVSALPQGNVGHLFPLLGEGTSGVLRGGAWMLGCTATACVPPRGVAKPSTLTAALAAGIFTALFFAWLLPYSALRRPMALADRLLLPAQLSHPLGGWPLLSCAFLLLLIATLTASLSRCAACFSAKYEKKARLLLALSLIPAAAFPTRQVLEGLLFLAPLRGVLVPIGCLLLRWKRRVTHA